MTRTIPALSTRERLGMRRPLLLWLLSFVITVASGVYQRLTGPSYPVSGSVVFEGTSLRFRFDRSHPEISDHAVTLQNVPPSVSGVLLWRRHKMGEMWHRAPMERAGDTLQAMLPQQPPAGKLDYRVALFGQRDSVMLPMGEPVVVRFTAAVPATVLVLHVLAMFAGMLLSTRTGLEAFAPSPHYERLVPWTLALLLVGGVLVARGADAALG